MSKGYFIILLKNGKKKEIGYGRNLKKTIKKENGVLMIVGHVAYVVCKSK